MNNTQEIFDLAKILHDAKVECCHFNPDWERKKKEFPEGLTPRQYVVQQPWIDVALAQARAIKNNGYEKTN